MQVAKLSLPGSPCLPFWRPPGYFPIRSSGTCRVTPKRSLGVRAVWGRAAHHGAPMWPAHENTQCGDTRSVQADRPYQAERNTCATSCGYSRRTPRDIKEPKDPVDNHLACARLGLSGMERGDIFRVIAECVSSSTMFGMWGVDGGPCRRSELR